VIWVEFVPFVHGGGRLEALGRIPSPGWHPKASIVVVKGVWVCVNLRRKGDGGGGRRCWVTHRTTMVQPWLSGDACVEGGGGGSPMVSLVRVEEGGGEGQGVCGGGA